MRKNIDIFENLTQVAEYHRNRWPTIRRNIYFSLEMDYFNISR